MGWRKAGGRNEDSPGQPKALSVPVRNPQLQGAKETGGKVTLVFVHIYLPGLGGSRRES